MATVRPSSASKIADAARELLRTKGPSAVTVERVATEAGVARTTIYRRFADRHELLTDALRELADPPGPDEHDISGEGRLRWVAEHAAAMVLDGIGFGGSGAVLDNADPAFTATLRAVLQEHWRALAEELEAGVADGSLHLHGEAGTVVDSIIGALLAEYGRTGTITDDWADRMVALHRGLIVDS
ncbi:TetR/AcrR family transcriptional regulator [Gordonia alkaliphila]|uniref:TetR/AcrR family transcriptional regulator n=1 Tax=Gordonia alkaliphila TaxID=1053547 RepID=UPI001FF28967|nr:TetR/AcrR family transcriptional regulator [Gordonia alkaliphila]MCK0439367.1 TetR/AcrR family transcriptional regulator [Gordonia alkaliphila]